ncbi:hypothetical protein SXCC_02575 [Gluconacetobacter sp. SXCC-1]|nr:hypothetical protein SXCC_02575 [Gluconacetobacter sp. SXCC-1]
MAKADRNVRYSFLSTRYGHPVTAVGIHTIITLVRNGICYGRMPALVRVFQEVPDHEHDIRFHTQTPQGTA